LIPHLFGRSPEPGRRKSGPKTIVTNAKNKLNNELKIKARAVSRGIAIGKVVSLYGKKRQYYRIELKESQLEREIDQRNPGQYLRSAFDDPQRRRLCRQDRKHRS
jgi:hypothetical protein